MATRKIFQFENDPNIQNWMAEITQLKKEISKLGLVRKGSIFERWHVCGTPNCKCKKDKKLRHGPYFAWTSKEKTKTVTIMIPSSLVQEAKGYLDNAKQLQVKTNQWIILSEKILRKKIELYRKLA